MSTTLSPQSLWQAARRIRAEALRCGALQPIATTTQVVRDGGVDFIVRLAEGLAAKPSAYERGPADRPPRRDPFAEPEPELTVGELSPTHRCLLNKFPVVDAHLLLVTRAFEDQQTPLSAADFAALAAGLRATDALGFYNSGPEAGASQRHKHLQIVPLPLGEGDAPALPIEAALGSPAATPGRTPALAFEHRLVGLDAAASARDAARQMHAHYLSMLDALGLSRSAPAPYNLLATRAWMLLVPRERECFEGIEVNGLGFAGALFARSEAAMERILEVGPMRLLTAVTRARA